MPIIFDAIRQLNQDVARNIVRALTVTQAFSDLTESVDDSQIAEKAINFALKNQNSFYYSTAIGYPFETDNFMASRFSDGTFPVWYGSMDLITTIYETANHMIKSEMAIKTDEEIIIRERTIYDVLCEGILIDLTRKKKNYPELISENYQTTQRIGKLLAEQGYPGVLSPSARFLRGINVNIFKQEILNNPRVSCELNYHLFPKERIVKIMKKNKIWMEISW